MIIGDLSFDTLREANQRRLPQFKNKKGELAHTRPDGSDWDFATWFASLLGELGELAAVRLAYEDGAISRETYFREAGKEFADVQTYLDLLAMRGKDISDSKSATVMADPQIIMHIVKNLGQFANLLKKYRRGDVNKRDFREARDDWLAPAINQLMALKLSTRQHSPESIAGNVVGFDLGVETANKFNEVSDRVGVKVKFREGESYDDSPHLFHVEG